MFEIILAYLTVVLHARQSFSAIFTAAEISDLWETKSIISTSFSAKRFNVNVIGKSRTDNFLSPNPDILALNCPKGALFQII